MIWVFPGPCSDWEELSLCSGFQSPGMATIILYLFNILKKVFKQRYSALK